MERKYANMISRLKILQIIRGHARARNAILNDLDQRVFGISLAEAPVAQINAGHLIAVRSVAQNTIHAEQAAAFLDVRGRIGVLRKQPRRQGREERERKQSHRHCLSMEIALYVIAPGGVGQCDSAGARHAGSLI